jgi:Rrf2 family transcriptional regulator, nitric oxide-sensitive transcriptional repressor
MKFSKSTELAIHGLWLLANKCPELLLVSVMADAQNVSESYLAKIFQKLARKGLVNSTRGKRGGFTLARAPGEISVADVVRAAEAEESLYDCMDVARGCQGRSSCLLREVFNQAERQMYKALENTSLADLMSCGNGDARAPWMI